MRWVRLGLIVVLVGFAGPSWAGPRPSPPREVGPVTATWRWMAGVWQQLLRPADPRAVKEGEGGCWPPDMPCDPMPPLPPPPPWSSESD